MSIFAGPKLRYLWGKHNEITFKNFDQKGIHERLYPFNVSAVIGVGVNISRIFSISATSKASEISPSPSFTTISIPTAAQE